MRIYFNNTDRPKAAAKLLVREAGGISLAVTHEAIATALGYRDWHDLQTSSCADRDDELPIIADWRAVILSVCSTLGVGYGDVQYALTRARVIPEMPLADCLTTRASIWRERLFGVPGRGRPGTVVRVNAPGEKRSAYLLAMGQPAQLLYDTGFGICADFEVVTPKVPIEDFVPSRLWLPYGFWTLADRSIVTFSRDYMPMWRTAQGVTERLNPWLWVNGIRDETHFSTIAGTPVWSDGRARELALKHLSDHRIVGLPRLLDVMEYCLASDVESVGQAVERMRAGQSELAA